MNTKFQVYQSYCFLMMFLLFLSCNRKEVLVNVDNIPDGGILLTSWHILGPFPSKMINYLYFDNLKQFGFTEDKISFDEYLKIIPPDTIKKFFYKTDSFNIDFKKVFGYSKETSIRLSAYCACVIKSSRKQTLKLNFSAVNGSRIWLNHKLIHDYNRGVYLTYYEHYIDLDLERGNNFLLVKVITNTKLWEMFGSLENASENGYERNKIAYSLDFRNKFLNRSVIKNDSLYLNDGLHPGKGLFCIKDLNGKTIFSDSINEVSRKYFKNVSFLTPGLYKALLYTKNDTFSERLFIGDIVEEMRHLLKSLKQLKTDDDTKRNIEALAYRYSLLLKKGNLPKGNPDGRKWDRRMIIVYVNLNTYYKNIFTKNKPDSGASGAILKTYLSKIDGNIQYYQVFVPKSYTPSKPLPLVIELAKYMKRYNSPLETVRFANIDLIELFEYLADKYNMIIVEPGCRTVENANKNAIEEADFWEALDDVKKYYNL
jgi:hypothetical protein